MSATEVHSVTSETSVREVNMKLEVQIIPVSDVDRAKGFYERLGWRLDDDAAPLDGLRIVQFTPPGSGTSVTFGHGLTTAAPGSAEGGLIVSDIGAAHDELVGRGIEVSNVWHGPPFPVEARQPGADPDRTSYGSFFSFNDPDGNTWIVQEVTTRLPGRVDPTETAFASARRPGERASACRGRPRRASEAHGAVAPFSPVEPRRELARLVCLLYGGGAGRERSAGVTDFLLKPRRPPCHLPSPLGV